MIKRVGVVGLGDMGSGLARNLIKNGFDTLGFDLVETRMKAFEGMGGHPMNSAGATGRGAFAVFVMVMNGAQAKSVIFEDDGLSSTMNAGTAIIMTATVAPAEAREIASELASTGIHLIDCPVSGGFPGAQSGQLSMMASAPSSVIEEFRPFLDAVSKTVYIVGEEPGMGQTVKACLQSLIGSIFTATFEATALAARAGVDANALCEVISNSSAGCGAARTALENIVNGQFENTGSHIKTMYKDMTISMDLARELGVPLFTAATAMQLFQAGRTKYPNGDNWAVTRVLEEIVDAKLRRRDTVS